MTQVVLRYLKGLLTRVGAHLSMPALHRLQLIVSYLKLGQWMSSRGYIPHHRVRDRDEVFSVVASEIADKPVLYLEFGVYQGASMRYWSSALKHPESVLHGFDSFEGLPEDFDANGPYVKGAFSTNGTVPQIQDSRVRFFKGWFEELLPHYSVPPHENLVVNFDADLYSSTIYVLRFLRPWIKPGTLIYFDELSRTDHEPRAFDEFAKETGLTFTVVCAEQSLNRAFFRCVADQRQSVQIPS